jgi:hypothetical protein
MTRTRFYFVWFVYFVVIVRLLAHAQSGGLGVGPATTVASGDVEPSAVKAFAADNVSRPPNSLASASNPGRGGSGMIALCLSGKLGLTDWLAMA